MRLLNASKAPTTVFTKYSNYIDVFLSKFVVELLKHTGINNHAIELENSKWPLYGLIYSLRPVELETLKALIKTNLANGFIKPSKLLTGALILINYKPDKNFCLCVHYFGFHNLRIKN